MKLCSPQKTLSSELASPLQWLTTTATTSGIRMPCTAKTDLKEISLMIMLVLSLKDPIKNFCFQLNASTAELFANGGSGKSEDGKWYNAIKNRLQLWPEGRIPYTISSQYSSYRFVFLRS